MDDNENIAEGGKPDDARVAVLVLGMHRSGTSAIARVLSLLGCDLPISLLGPGRGNIAGHWESSAIWHFNDELLASGKSNWEDWLEFDHQWYGSPPYDDFVQRGRELLREEFGSSSLFVFKDPRNCRLFPFWHEVLKRELIRPVIVIALRHPREAAQSLAARDHLDPVYVEHLWLRHLLEAEFHTRGLPRVVTSYDGLLHDWQGSATRMEQVFGFPWPDRSPLTQAAITDFLDHELRHHWLSDDQSMPGWICATYRILSEWARNGENPADHADLDQIRHALNGAAPNFAGWATSTVNQPKHVDALEMEVRAKADQVATISLAHATLAQEHQCIRQERSALQLELAQTQLAAADRDRLVDQLQTAEQERAIMQQEIEKLRQEAQDRVNGQQREQAEIRALCHANSAMRHKLDDVKTKLAATEGVIRELLAQHQADAHQCDSLGAELRGSRHRIMELERSANTAMIELRQRVRQISILSGERDQQSQNLAAAFGHIEWLRDVLMLITAQSSGWTAMPEKWRQRQIYQMLRREGLFDAEGYLTRHTDVAAERMDPLRHYVFHGMAEGRCR